MKRLVISIILCVVCAKAHATTPFAPKVFENNSWTFVAGFAWPDENDKVLIIRTVRKTVLLSLDDLGVTRMDLMTTAGSQWYQQAIGYVTSVKLKGTDSGSNLRVFYFRNRNGRESVVNLKTSKLIDSSTILNRADLDKKTVSEAVSLLRSDRPQDRETAAMHLGQLGATEYLRQLTELLHDKAAYTQIRGKEQSTVYYVKEAAEKAIELIKSKTLANKAMDSDKK